MPPETLMSPPRAPTPGPERPDPAAQRRRLAAARRAAERIYREPDRFPGDTVVIPISDLLGDRHRGFSRERLRVLLTVRTDGPFDSLDALAEALGRPKARVSQDVHILEQLGLLRSARDGRFKRIEADPRPILLA